MSGFKFSKPGIGVPSLPPVEQPAPVAPPVAEVKAPAKPKAKPVAKKAPAAADSEKADQQIVAYITKSEMAAFKAILDGRPVSGFVRKLIKVACHD